MLKGLIHLLTKVILLALVLVAAPQCAFAQRAANAEKVTSLYDQKGHLNQALYANYKQKAQALLARTYVNKGDIWLSVVENKKDIQAFKNFVGSKLQLDQKQMIVLVGENKISTEKQLKAFVDAKLIEYKAFYSQFIAHTLEQSASLVNRSPIPFGPGRAPGQPCQNMDFETQSLTAWTGSYGSSCDPVAIAGFNNLGINSGTGQHTIMTAGVDPNVGVIPCVMPGGSASLRLGDPGFGGNWAARISQVFMVQPGNPFFTYNYAVVLQDAGHVLAEQPYFRIRMFNSSGGLIDCATLDVDATNSADLLSDGLGNKYKNWTQVVIPLQAYVGQNVTIEFTTADCNNGAPNGGSHDGYAYIDCSCTPPSIFTSSPSICGGTSISVSAPAGLSSYSWTGPGIVGASNTQTISVNQAGTYTVTMLTNTTPPHIPCTFVMDTIIPGNPANPIAQFVSSIVCQGAPTVFTDQSTPSGSISSWAWDFDNNGSTDDATQNPSHTFPAAGSFPVTLTVTSGPCTDNFTANVTVNPGIAPVINPAGPYCTNAAPVTLTATVAGGTWSGAGITNAATGAFDPSLAAVGNNTISYTTAGACGGTTTAVIVINPLPTSAAGPDVTICSGSPASIGTTTTAGYTYAWLPAAGLSSAAISNPSITTVNAGTTPIVTTYTVTTSAAGCSTTDDVVVTVNPLPVLTITNPAAVCTPNTVDITVAAVTAGSTGGGTLTYWTDAAATIPLAGPTAVGTSGTYYIKVTASGGCTDIDPVVVTINPLPVSVAGTDVTICSGTAASIGGAPTAGNNYAWLPAAGLSATNVANPSITTVNAGTTPIVTTYTVTTTVAATGCTSTDDVLVTVNPQPVLTITNPAPVCSPGSVDISAAAVTAGSTGGGTFTYWNDAAATNPLAAPTAVTSSGTYYIQVTATGGCTDIDPVVVTVNPLPVSNAGTDVMICTGTAASIGTAATAGYTYLWAPATGISATNVSNPSNTTTNAGTTPIVTTYTVTTTIAATGCTSTDTVVITVNPFPVLTITNPAAVCSPGTVNITAASITAGSVGGGVLSYWTDAAATIPLASPTAVATSGTYYIQMLSGAGCSDINPVTVTINPLPVSDAGPDVVICTGSAAPLGTASTAGYDYLWSPAVGLTSTNTSNPTVSLTNISGGPVTSTYVVTTTILATGCFTTDSVNVTVNIVATANAGSSQSVCAGSSITLAGAVGGSATGGTWSGGAGTFTPNNTTLNAVYTPNAAEFAAGSVTLTLTTDDPTGPCTFASSSVTFFFYENPAVNFTVIDPNGCPVHCASFTDQTTIGGGDTIVSWNWDFGDGSPDSTSQNTSHCYPASGFYDVTLTATSNHGCISTLTIPHAVTVYPEPNAAFTVNPFPASVLDPLVTLNNASSSDVVYWYYYFGDGDSIAPFTPSPEHAYPNTAAADYVATLIVENGNGCRDTTERPVTIGPEFTFFIPNAFTPNGDGVNDFFYGQGIGIVDYDIYIFDRWGNMIYHGDNIYASYWDGRANKGDDVAQQDVYVWKVRLTDVFGKKHNYIGTVTLVK